MGRPTSNNAKKVGASGACFILNPLLLVAVSHKLTIVQFATQVQQFKRFGGLFYDDRGRGSRIDGSNTGGINDD